MKCYDEMPAGKEVPYSMLSGPINYNSDIINTDEYGFRLTEFKDKKLRITDLSKYDVVNFIVGGSTVFGVGAENDSTTISSMLSEKTNEPWFNLGLRGGVSFQEYINLISFINKPNKVRNVIFLSGVNDFYINELTDTVNKYDNRFTSIYSLWGAKDVIKAALYSKLLFIDAKDALGKNFSELIFKRNKNDKLDLKIDRNKKNEILNNNMKRNFMLYSALKKELNLHVCYILQPFAYWVDKELSEEEKTIFKYLDHIQKDTQWGSQKEKMAKGGYDEFERILKNSANKYKVKFLNSNHYIKTNETLFVDSVHLNGRGNELLTNIIIDSLKGDV